MNRVKKLKERLSAKGKLPYFINLLSDIYYLSGFTGSTAYILLSETEDLFITDGRYMIQATDETGDLFKIEIVDSYIDFLRNLFGRFQKIYVTKSLNLGLYLELSKYTDILIDEIEEINQLRMIKDPEEIIAIKKSYEIAAIGFYKSLNSFKFGKTEKEWAAMLEYNMKINGAKKESFDTIVASGYRGALPHGVASDKIINKDEPIIIDYGARVNYVSDITRVIYNGNNDEILNNINILLDTINIAIDNIKPGTTCSEIYNIAKKHLSKYNLDIYFNHGLGHSLGIDVHESPYLNRKDNTIIEENMVFTVEPGVYFTDEYGLRIEETVLVNKNGCEILSSMLKEHCFKI